MTVSEAAKQCGLSRTTPLYYESMRLLRPPRRKSNGYRSYGEAELAILKRVCAYRQAGLTVADIRAVLNQRDTDATAVLQRRLVEISGDIERLRQHQRAIFQLLGQRKRMERNKVITKEKWVSIMAAAGLSKEDMNRWHHEFEKSAPTEHQEFLEFLHIPAEEIRTIRSASRGSAS